MVTSSPATGRATLTDTAGVALDLLAPTLAGGVIARRPALFGLADRLEADRRAIRRLRVLAARYGPGPVRLAVPGRSLAVVLSPEHVHRVLAGSPEPFALANLEKRAALGHFQPRGVLVSHGRQRAERREFNEHVLDTDQPVHRLGAAIVGKVVEEAERLADQADRSGRLSADQFVVAWWRVIRRVVLGDDARDDHEISNLLTRLRREANWGYLAPRREKVYRRFKARLGGYLDRAEPHSLASVMAETPAGPGLAPEDQVPQWLFAYDPAGLATLRALALLATHGDSVRRAREQLHGEDGSSPALTEELRASVLESVRLWPTTPLILRDTTEETEWPSGTLPAGTALLIYAPYFHRDEQALPQAHRYAPETWYERRGPDAWPLVPFSEGPGVCPGQNLVLLTATTFLATLLRRHDYRLVGAALDPPRPLPMTFSPYRLRFRVTPVAGRG